MPKPLAQPAAAPNASQAKFEQLAARFLTDGENVAPSADQSQYAVCTEATTIAEAPQSEAAAAAVAAFESIAARFMAAGGPPPPPPSPAPVPPPPPSSPETPETPDAGAAPAVDSYACEQFERERGRAVAGDWKRRPLPAAPVHHAARDFGAWIDKSAQRVTRDPAGMGSLVSACALAPGLLAPTAPEILNDLAERVSLEESDDGEAFVFCREPFADVPPRESPQPLSARERKRFRSEEERYTERAMRVDVAMRRWAAWWRELGESLEHLPPLADPETYAICRAIVCSVAAADAALRMIGSNYGGNVLYRVQRNVFGTRDETKWDTRMLCARRAIALAVFMLRQSRLKYTGKRDRFGRAIMQPCVWGIGRGYLQSLLAEPLTMKPLSRERLTHSNDTCKGLFEKAELARVFVRQSKIPPDIAEPDEIGPSGYTFNRYWVCRHYNPKAALREELDGLDAAEASAAAWEWLDAGIRAALRGRFLKPAASVDLKWSARERPS